MTKYNSSIKSSNILKILLLTIYILLSILPVFPKDLTENQIINVTPGNTIITLDINNSTNTDYEVYVNSDNTFSLPFKAIATLFNIPFKQNHLTKEINFNLDDGRIGSIDYQKQKITIGDKVIDFNKNNFPKLAFVKEGLMETSVDEVFVPIKVINDILNINIKPDMLNYSIAINTDKVLKAAVKYNETAPDNAVAANKTKENYNETILPSKNPIISLKAIEFSNNSQYNINNGGDPNSFLNNSDYNNFSQINIKGSLLDGNYVINTNTRYSNDNAFNFGGLTFNYTKALEKYYLELGDISGVQLSNYTVGKGIIGVDFNNYANRITNYREIKGKVNLDSKINVYINNKLFETLPTVAGYYNLSQLHEYTSRVNTIKLEEVSADGKTKIIKVVNFPYSPYLLPKGVSDFAIIGGITGYDNRFFSNYSLDNTRSKKLTEGIKYSYGLTDKTTLNSTVISDQILSLPSQQNIYIPDNSILGLALESSRDFDSIYGQTGLLLLDYVPYTPLYLNMNFGLSHQTNKDPSNQDNIHSLGYLTEATAKYKNPYYNVYTSLYDYSPDFYLAGSSNIYSASAILNDKIGGKIGSGFLSKYITLNGEFNKYYTNLDNRIDGGKFSFNEYNLQAKIPVKYFSELNCVGNYKIGNNDTGKIVNQYYKIDWGKKLTRKLDLALSGSYNDFYTHYNATGDSTDSGYSSDFWIFTAKANYELPKHIGNIDVSHDMVKIVANNYNVPTIGSIIPLVSIVDKYNDVRVGYAFPTFFRITPYLSGGYHYTGINKGFDYGASLAYTFDTGRKLELSYKYNRQLGTFINDIFIPAFSKQSIEVNLSDAVGIIDNNIKSIGAF